MSQPEQPATLSPVAARIVRRELTEQACALQRQANWHDQARQQLALRVADIQLALAELKTDA